MAADANEKISRPQRACKTQSREETNTHVSLPNTPIALPPTTPQTRMSRICSGRMGSQKPEYGTGSRLPNKHRGAQTRNGG
jgi:hypothetical protein